MNAYQFAKQRQAELSKISIKGKRYEELQDLLIKYSNGLEKHLYFQYRDYPRLNTFLPEVEAYQSLVYQACVKTVDVYDYYRWKKYGDKKAKMRVQKWIQGERRKFAPKTKLTFNHLGHLYGYMYQCADTLVRMNIQNLTQEKRFGIEIYASQIKNQELSEEYFFDSIVGPQTDTQAEANLFHREIISRLPKLELLNVRGRSYSYAEIYYMRYVLENSGNELSRKLNYSVFSILECVKVLNELLVTILKERQAA